MAKIGTALTASAKKVMLLGSGELGKEVCIELQRLGVEVVAVDRYANAPAMHVAHHARIIDMTDASALRSLVNEIKPDLIVPEIEAIATDELARLETEGFHIVPTARATQITMDREGIRTLASETLGLKTSPYRFAESEAEMRQAMAEIGLPCVVKPVMSSSGKGQSTAYTETDMADVWSYSQSGGRTGPSRVIVEGFIDFDYEITLLTVRHKNGTSFCAPIGHRQEGGDYRESWQPQPMSNKALQSARHMAAEVTKALGGQGVFGVEFFVKGDEVIFSEISPRPHDTGLVTLISQNLSEFALHARAILDLPIPTIKLYNPSASAVIIGEGKSDALRFSGLDVALKTEGVNIYLFGKPEINGTRRLGVAVATADTVEIAKEKACAAAQAVKIHYE